MKYFPAPLQQRYPAQIAEHRLRREIIATVVTNSLVNRMGPTFVQALCEKTGMAASDVTRAYAVTRGVFELRRLWSEIQTPDTKVPAAMQNAMLLRSEEHKSELQSLMRNSYAVLCVNK